MPYQSPRVRVFQEFRQIPTAVADPLRALIIGPHGVLHRYSVASEKETIDLGTYDPDAQTEYEWPDRIAGSTIDLNYTKLFIDDAMLRYYSDSTGYGPTIVPVSGYRNRIRANTLIFKTENGFDRSSVFYDRDVKAGDFIRVRGIGGDSEEHTLLTTVKNFVGEVVASEVDTATSDEENKDSQSLATSIDKVSGPDNGITLTAYGSSYDGLEDGDIDETYTIEVTQSSVGGDLATARLRVTSSSGRDNQSSVTPAGAGGNTAIGTRGLLVEFDVNNTGSAQSAADLDGVSVSDLVLGQKWRVRVKQAFTAPNPTASGTYTGEQDTTYIITVTKGGRWADEPEITVTTSTAYDFGSPIEVTAAATAVDVGNYGVQIAFSGNGLCKGDRYYIEAFAAEEGAIRTLVLSKDLPEDLLTATDLSIDLFIRKNIQIEQNRAGFAPLTNWEASQDAFTVNDGITVYESSWTDDGTELPLDVTEGTLYVEYREWSSEFVGELFEISDSGEVATVFGTAAKDNPLAFGVLKALENANGTVVRYTAVADPDDDDSWLEAINDIADSTDAVYNLVPLTYDSTVRTATAAHATSQSSADVGRWRATFLAIETPNVLAIVDNTTSEDSDTVLATLADSPAQTGTQYTQLSITSGNANLEDLDVRAGDEVRFLYTTDGFGNLSYTTFVVGEVLSEETLLLTSGHTSSVTVPQRVEIHRNLTQAQKAAQIAATAGSFGNRRVCAVWAENPKVDGEVVENYFVAAALAGLRSGVAPHQPLTNVEILGFDSIQRTFSSTNLDTMAEAGTWLVVQNNDGNIVTRHALTTDTTDLNSKTESIRSNVDSISYVILDLLKNFIGRSNINSKTIEVIETNLASTFEFLKSRTFTNTSGSQLIDAVITKIEQSSIQADKIDAYVTLTVPAPLNYLDVYLQI